MTKRKAIEAAKAMEREGRVLLRPGVLVSERALDWLWEQGRIAGLREAAALWVCPPAACRKRANALAKKARAK